MIKEKQINKNEMKENKKGVLYIVGTPIGNMKDITLRALETLKECDIILAEDTRQTIKLLNKYEIKKSMISYHMHNEKEKIDEVIKLLDKGKKIVLVSDAGMPRLSDPGEILIKYCINNKYNLEVIPGVTALTTAIALSNIDTETFVFEGFLPVKASKRKERLENLKYEDRTIVFYEAPHKLLKTLKDLQDFLGKRNICIARELTKIHEEYIYSNLEDELNRIRENGIKGEIVLLVEGNKEGNKSKKQEEKVKKEKSNLSNIDLVKRYIKEGHTKKDAVKMVASDRGLNKNEVYMECIKING